MTGFDGTFPARTSTERLCSEHKTLVHLGQTRIQVEHKDLATIRVFSPQPTQFTV